MDGIDQTHATYERDSDTYVQKYRTESVLATHGEPFLDRLGGARVLNLGCGTGVDVAALLGRGSMSSASTSHSRS